MSYFLFVLNNFLAALIASSLSLLTIGGNKHKKILAALAGFPVVITLVLLILGTLGKLSAVWASFLLIPSAVILLLIQKRSLRGTDHLYPRSEKPSENRLLLYLSIGLSAVILGVFIYKTSLTGTHFGWDDFNHHAAVAGHWLKDRRLSLAPFGFQAYYPHNAELISLWFMLPFRSDALVNLSGLYWGGLAGAATFVLVFWQAGSLSVLLVSILLSSTIVLRSALTFCAVDLAGPAMALSALALIIPSHHQEPPGPAETWYGGLFSGFALGCRVSFIYVPVVIIFGLLIKKQPEAGRMKAIGLFFAGLFFTGSYWYLRNFFLTGNPVFPGEFGPFQGPFSGIAQSRTTLIGWILSGSVGYREWWDLLKRYLDWPYGLGLLAVFGYGGVGCQWLKNQKTIRPATVWLFITGLTALFLYPFTPFSGTVNLPSAPLAAFPRYLITPFALGLILFSRLLENKFPGQKLWQALLGAVTAIVIYDYFSHYVNKATMSVGILFLCLFYLYYNTNLFKTNRRMANSALLLAALCVLALGKTRNQELTDARVYNYRRRHVCFDMGEAWRFLETLPEGADLESFGTISKQYYPLFGRKFQFNIKRIEYEPMHEYWRQGTFWDDWGEKSGYYRRREYDRSTLISRLMEEKVDYILVSRIGLRKWPLEKSLLASSGLAREIYSDPCTVIWKITSGKES